MIRPWRVFVVLAVVSVTAMALGLKVINDRPPPRLPPLPAGKVKPHVKGGLLLAPDGTLSRMFHSGEGGPTSLSFPPLIPGNDWKEVSGSWETAVGIKQDGTLWIWQRTPRRALFIWPPAKIGTDNDWAHASYGPYSAALLTGDGSLWGLGDQYRDNKSQPDDIFPAMQPVQLAADRGWIAVENCNEVSYGLKQDGTIWRWGRTPRGGFNSTPVLIGADSDWTAITNCTEALAALKKDGSLWLTGEKAHRVAYDFASGPTDDFVRIGSESDWQEIFGGARNLIARRSDGSWWATGENHHSQLGIWKDSASRELGRPTRMPFDFDLWAWSSDMKTSIFLTRDGNFHCIGVTPASNYRPPKGLDAVKAAVNKAVRRLPGSLRLFDEPEPPQHAHPVKIGELPPSVVSALESVAASSDL